MWIYFFLQYQWKETRTWKLNPMAKKKFGNQEHSQNY